MIEIKTYNENDHGYQLSIHVDGDGVTIVQQLTSIFDRIYEESPTLFQTALVMSKYTEDHT